MRKTVITTGVVVVFTLVALLIFVRFTTGEESMGLNFSEAEQGGFEIAVSATGELLAENSIDIKGPDIVQNRNFRSSAVKILDLVPEGTEVKKGDYIAQLDKTVFDNTLKDEKDELKRVQTDYDMKLLDTALVLGSLRDAIKDQSFVVEENSITLDQSKYEPPAVQRKAELSLDKSKRLLEQQRKLYKLRKSQALSELRVLRIDVENQKEKVEDLSNVLRSFTIVAPNDGMVLYKKDRMGNKNKTGSVLNPWDPTVATLPDLSSMLSRIYISEIDISKIKTGMPVQISIDAFKGNSFSGKIDFIANIGEDFSGSDSKVFEVLVKLEGNNSMLRPSMTTGNKIIIKTYDNVVYVPIESVHAGADRIPYVYTESGTKQVVVLGESNDKHIIIEKGLAAGTSVWLTTPEDPQDFEQEGDELIPIIVARQDAIVLEMEKIRKNTKLITESEPDVKTKNQASEKSSSDGQVGTAGGI